MNSLKISLFLFLIFLNLFSYGSIVNISNCTGLRDIQTDNAGLIVKLTANINCSGSTFNPIGSYGTTVKGKKKRNFISSFQLFKKKYEIFFFLGVIEGDNYTISDLRIIGSSNYTALIVHAYALTIRNLYLENIYVESSASNVATLVGFYQSGTVSNVHLKSSIINSTGIGTEKIGGKKFSFLFFKFNFFFFFLKIGLFASADSINSVNCSIKSSRIISNSTRVGGITA